jgi:hypothetical protein
MEIKILCQCGSKFKFDVEPIDGRSPGPVQCPSCGKDGTEATNAQIQEKLLANAAPAAAAAPPAMKVSAGQAASPGGPQVSIPAAVRIPAAAVKVSAPVSVSAAAPASSPTPSSPPAPAPAPAVMPVAPSAAGAPATPSVGPKMTVMPVPSGGAKALSVSAHAKAEEKPSGEIAAAAPSPMTVGNPARMKLGKGAAPKGPIRVKAGVAGAIAGGLLGMIIWYFVVITTGNEAKWLAIMVGTLAGWGGRLLAGGKHSTVATAAGVSAIVGIGLGQYLAILFIMAEFKTEIVEGGYKERMTLAKKAVNAKTDAQIREVMVEDIESDFLEENPKEIDDESVAQYRTNELRTLQKFAGGTPSRTQYEQKLRTEFEESGIASYHFQLYTVIWIVAGITVAWKIVRPPEDEH